MAQAGQGKIHPGRRKANPMMTKNGKPRLGPLNMKQLTDLLAKTTKPKEKFFLTYLQPTVLPSSPS
jgi:hypothetical protein